MILLVGPSASGKTEAAKVLASRFGIVKAVTHTTRPPRAGERNGVDYHFVSEEEFLKLMKEDAFVETTLYSGFHYGCSKKEISDRKCVVVDPSGFHSFLALGDKSIVTFYMDAKEETRIQRMKGRGDDLETLRKRIETDRDEFSEEIRKKADYLIVTDRRPLVDIVSEIYERYLVSLKKRGISL